MKLSNRQAAGLPTQNREWGFFGTLVKGGFTDEEAQTAFETAGNALITQLGMTPEEARDALDSTIGRHTADMITDQVMQAKRSALNTILIENPRGFALNFRRRRK